MSPIIIVKSTGEQEEFDQAKLLGSLQRAGATKEQADAVLLHVQGELVSGMTTSEIYRHAFEVLRSMARPTAARYSMKRAIAELGPDGFPFERFVAEIFKAHGFEAVTGQIVQGSCVEHEIDVVAWKGKELVMVEAKFHNEHGIKSDLKVALYVKARFDDLKGNEYEFGGKKRKLTSWQLFTNTKFSDRAVRYAECQGLSLIGWNYPKKGNLEDLIIETGLHPLTSLTSLSVSEKKALLDAGLVLARHIREREADLATLGVEKTKIPSVLAEADSLTS